MADEKDPKEPKAASAKADGGAEQMQQRADAEYAKGHRGVAPDPTPNEHYTVDGVTSGAPTPETDPAMAERAFKAQRRSPLDHLGR